MGAASSVVPEKVDLETFKSLCGDRFTEELYENSKLWRN
jgi:hypothetical protein